VALNDSRYIDSTIKTKKINNSVSPVKKYIKYRPRINVNRTVDEDSDINDRITPCNQTYEIKRKTKLLEKVIEEKKFQKNEKLRDIKRLKRRKLLDNKLKNNFLKKQKEKLRMKFDGDLNKMEKLK